MTKNLKVLIAASECAPMVRVGDLGDAIYGLAKVLAKLGIDVRVILPLYKTIDAKTYNLKPIFRGKRLKIGGGNYGIGLFRGLLPGSKVPIYFIENKNYFGSGGVYFSKITFSSDKKEIARFTFFSNAVFELLKNKLLPYEPDIVHANDWQTGALVGALKRHNEQLTIDNKRRRKQKGKKAAEDQRSNVSGQVLRSIFTIHDLSNQGILRNKNYIKEGIFSADLVTTVSPTHAEEIQTKEHGFGLHATLRKKKPAGILNGLDYGSLHNHGDKSAHKLRFQKVNGLKRGNAYPLFSMTTQLRSQKGVQWVIPVVSSLVELYDAQFAFLGAGEDEFEEALTDLARRYPQNVLTKIGFDEKLAQSIYAASDFFLTPSAFESCGQSPMMAMRYGTLPIARMIGGLKDIIVDGKNGFLYEEKNEKGLLRIIERALGVFVDTENFNSMRARALREDFGWEKPGAQYAKIYKQLITNN